MARLVFHAFLLVALLSSAALAQPAVAVDPQVGLKLANRHVRFVFDPRGMGLAQMIDLQSGVDHIVQTSGKHTLWELSFAGGSQMEHVDNNYKPCSRAYIERVADGVQRAVMEWTDVRWWLEDRMFTLRVTVDLPDDSGIASWHISVDNRSDYWGLWSVAFPLVQGFPASGQYDIARPTFASGGQLLRHWSGSINPANSRLAPTTNIEGRYPSGFWPMQFMSFQRGTSSVYFGTRDPDARAKDFTVETSGKTMVMHYPDNMGVTGSSYPDFYPTELGVYQGTWVQAAWRYREWALRQKWAQHGALANQSDLPQSIQNTSLWAKDGWTWDGGSDSPQQMNEPLVRFQRQMDVPVGLHWYQWHANAFDNQYPYFTPKPLFAQRVKDLVSRNFLVMPYINGTSADMNVADFARFAPYAIRNEGGGLRQHFYSESSGRLLSMCPFTKFWQKTIAGLASDLFERLGVNGLYVDQISAMAHEMCFSRAHGHPVGGGHYWTDGNRALLAQVREAAHRNGKSSVVASEGTDEVFIDLVDANLTWAEPDEHEIPLIQVVYSGRAIFFGSSCNLDASHAFFNRAQGQALIDGRQPGWMGLRLLQSKYDSKAAFLKLCAKYRTAGKKFLLFGRLLQPIEPSDPVASFNADGFGWRIPKHAAEVPAAEGRLWQSRDGHYGVFLANYVDEEVPYACRLDLSNFGETAKRFRVREIRPDGLGAGAVVGPSIELRKTLKPRSIQVIEIEPIRSS